MAADPNVFGQFLRMPPSAMDYADRFAASDAAQQQNAMSRLMMQDKVNAMGEQNRLRQLYQQNPGITADQLRQAGFRDEAGKLDSAALEKRKTETDIGYKEAQTSKEQIEAQVKAADAAYAKTVRHAQAVYSVHSPQEAVAWIDKAIDDGVPGFTKNMRDQAIAKLSEFKDLNDWKREASAGAIPVIDRFKQAAEDARAAIKASTPDYTVLDSSTGVVRVEKKTGLAQPVTYAPTSAPASAYVPPQASAPSQPVPPRPAASGPVDSRTSPERFISPAVQAGRDRDSAANGGMDRLSILIRELNDPTKSAADRADIQKEIDRMGGRTPAASPMAAPAAAPSAPIQLQPRQKDPGQPFEGADAAGPGMFQMIGGKPVRMEGLRPKGGEGTKIGAEVQRQIGGVMDFDKSLSALEDALKDFDPRSMDQFNTTKRARIGSLAKQAQLSAKEAAALGALSGPDMALLEGILADPTSSKGALFGRDGLLEQIQEARAGNKRRVKTISEQYGDKATAGMPASLKGSANSASQPANVWSVVEVK